MDEINFTLIMILVLIFSTILFYIKINYQCNNNHEMNQDIKKKEDRHLESSFAKIEDLFSWAKEALIMSSNKASQLKTEAIQKLLQDNFKEHYKAIENLNNIKYELMKEEPNQMVEQSMEKIKEAIFKIRNTIKEIKEIAEKNLIQESNTRLSPGNLPQPEFHGISREFPHIFKFKREFMDYLKILKIPLADCTPILIESIHGDAKKCLIQNNIKNTYMGDYEKVLKILKINYGEPDRILKTISKQLEAYGELPGLYSNVSWSEIVEVTQKVIGLIEDIRILEDESLLRRTDYLHLEEVLLKMVPREHFNKLQTQIENNEDLLTSFTCLLEQNKSQAYKKLWKECYEVSETQENEQKIFGYATQEESSNKKKPWFRVKYDHSQSCFICSVFKNSFPQLAHGIHRFFAKCTIEKESCPILREHSAKIRERKLQEKSICRVCCSNLIEEQHKEENCNYTEKFPKSKCNQWLCRKRFFVCGEHIMFNKQKLNEQKRYLEKLEIDFCPN